jgi:hypothetical protein
MALHDQPLLTTVYENVEDFLPGEGSIYIFGTSVEQRSAHSSEWEARAVNIEFVRIVEQTNSHFVAVIGSSKMQVSLRNRSQLEAFWVAARGAGESCFLDITGLSHHIWAPLLRFGLEFATSLTVTYVEPGEYRFSPAPTENEIFDLSEAIEGIAPVPGFAKLREQRLEQVCLVPLLGFEGTRFAYVVEQVQPPGENIVPIIGVPGFRPEYPFYSFHGNRLALTDNHAWKNVRFAIANCPFSLFYLLDDIAAENQYKLLKVAPIGTKPHALGAVMYAIARDHVELIYDYPIRKAKRTEGTARLLAYHVSDFMQD